MFKEEQSFLLEMKDLFFSEGFLKPSGIILYEADDFTLKVTAWGADENLNNDFEIASQSFSVH